jgi:hypothetical protein
MAPVKTVATPVAVSPGFHNAYIGHIKGTVIPEFKMQALPNPSLKYVVENVNTWKLYEYKTAKGAKVGVIKHNANHLTDIFVVGQS